MAGIAALFLAKIALGIAALGVRRSIATRIAAIAWIAIFRLEALHARQGIDQRAIHREMVGRQQRPNLCRLQHGGHEFGSDSPAISRSRFLVNTVTSQIAASIDGPTNQRNIRL